MKLTNTDVIISMTSGCVAGSLARSFTAPLDRTKIYFQTRGMKFTFTEGYYFMKNSVKNHGYLSLWRGSSATLIRIVPYAGLKFTIFDIWKDVLKLEDDVSLKPLRRFAAGSLAGCISTSLTYPLDLARANLAITDKDTYGNILHILERIYKQEGSIIRFYRGLTPTLFGSAIYTGTTFSTYETLKNWHKIYSHKNRSIHPLELMAIGSFAGIISVSIAYPFDTVRRRIQTSSITGSVYTGTWNTIKKVVLQEGVISGLYKGLSLNWIKAPIVVGISFTTFDMSKELLGKILK